MRRLPRTFVYAAAALGQRDRYGHFGLSDRLVTVRSMLDSATVTDWVYHAARWTWHDPDGYNFISGPLADITLLGGGYALFRHHNCHVKGCWRIGRAPVDGTSYVVCRKHHPHQAPTVEQVHAAHAEHQRRVRVAEQ